MKNYVELLELERHIEGGYFSLFYKSNDKVIPLNKRYESGQDSEKRVERYAGSSIYFLLEKEDFSAWHRLKSDEIWHYFDGGSAINIYVINAKGELEIRKLGNPGVNADTSFQVVVEAGLWFAAALCNKNSFALVSCTVLPAFEYDDFELAENKRDEFINQAPRQVGVIEEFIKPTVKNLTDPVCYLYVGMFNKLSPQSYITMLDLKQHINGGYLKENFTSLDQIAPVSASQENDFKFSAGSSFYFLLEKQDILSWQYSKADEIWHYCNVGSAINIYVINAKGELEIRKLGNPVVNADASFQVVIEAGLWFAAEIYDQSSFSLLTRSIFSSVKSADSYLNQNNLLSQFPQHGDIIEKFTRASSHNFLSSKCIKFSALALISGLSLFALAKNQMLTSGVNSFIYRP